ncbi:MAG: flagellar motor protein MotD [Betaproteobacteria bacterium]|nr:flagellar motor protein MotD [Betaproteobacteria bacterium]
MARKKRNEEHENLERWLVSYADFITLLFAFFVVMYAISSVNEGKYRVLSDSLVNAFRNVEIRSSGDVVNLLPNTPLVTQKSLTNKPPDAGKEKRREKMKNVARDIMEVMAPLVRQGKVRVLETSRGVTIEINDSVLFAPGQAQLASESMRAMQAVADVIARADLPVTIEGHTDNIPIHTPYFPSNWELSAVRATTVLRLFADAGVLQHKLTAIGYGETRPVAENDTIEGRARNRRVSILIDSTEPESASELGVTEEPHLLPLPEAADQAPRAAP